MASTLHHPTGPFPGFAQPVDVKAPTSEMARGGGFHMPDRIRTLRYRVAMTAATDLIAAERDRQIVTLGYDSSHDAEHDADDLAFAAVCYAAPMPVHLVRIDAEPAGAARFGGHMQWVEPWPVNWERPARATNQEERLDELVKAGALIAAEIDRLLAEGAPDGSE